MLLPVSAAFYHGSFHGLPLQRSPHVGVWDQSATGVGYAMGCWGLQPASEGARVVCPRPRRIPGCPHAGCCHFASLPPPLILTTLPSAPCSHVESPTRTADYPPTALPPLPNKIKGAFNLANFKIVCQSTHGHQPLPKNKRNFLNDASVFISRSRRDWSLGEAWVGERSLTGWTYLVLLSPTLIEHNIDCASFEKANVGKIGGGYGHPRGKGI